MTENQYKYHLKFLFNNNEKFLLEKTFLANKNLFKFQIKDIQIKEEELIIQIPLEISLEEYISKINCEILPNIKKKKLDNNEIYKIKIFGYYSVLDLIQGSSFGEIALINDNNQRTATIFVKEDSFFGVLKSHEYKNTMKKIQEKIKVDNITFIYSNLKIFNCINLTLFTQNYWNYFISGKLYKGEFLFKVNEKKNKVFFIQEGEIKLVCPNLNINKINEYINNLSGNKDKIRKTQIYQNENIILFISKKGDILGLNNILFKNKFICNGICHSKYCNYFSIDMNVLNEMKHIFEKVEENLNNYEKKKIDLMLKRLSTIKFTDESSLFNQINKDKLELNDSKNNVKSYFDTKGEGCDIKEAKIRKLSEILNLNKQKHRKRFTQIFPNLKPKITKILNSKKNHERLSIFSNLALKFDHETGNIIDRKEKRKNTLNYSKSLSDISYTNSNYSSSLICEDEKKNNNNSNSKLPKISNLNNLNNNIDNNIINSYNFHNGYNTFRNNYPKYNYFNHSNNKNQNNKKNKIQHRNLNNNNNYNNYNISNNNIYNNTISYKNINENNLKSLSNKKIAVIKLSDNFKSNLKKFNPIETAKIKLGEDIKEKNKEEEIKNSISFTEPNDLETKEFFHKIIKKEDNVTNILKKTFHKKIYSDNIIHNLRLFDNEMEKNIYGKKIHKVNLSYSGFKAKKFPPQFLVHGKKILLKK